MKTKGWRRAHWAASDPRCPNRRPLCVIEGNSQPVRHEVHRLCEAENAHSSNSLRRESLYPAELSGRGWRLSRRWLCSLGATAGSLTPTLAPGDGRLVGVAYSTVGQ